MKIQQLVKREPFGAILEKTLSGFLSQQFGTSFEVTWNPPSVFRDRTVDLSARWYCNSYLNAIFPLNAERVVLDTIWMDYVRTPFAYRRIPQWLYVTAATRSISARFFAKYTVEIKPSFLGHRGMLIVGGNNRIRLLDLNRRRIWDILKAGFDPATMRAEIETRQTAGDWPFLPLRAVAKDDTWFEADYVSAISLNRLHRGQNREPFARSALNALGRWLDRTCVVSALTTYASLLVEGIEELSRTCVVLNSADRREIRQWIEIALGIVSGMTAQKDLVVSLAVGHGDFQEGNILVDTNNQVWVVDWEHARQRQLAYDYLVFALRSRFPHALAARVRTAVENPGLVLESLPAAHRDVCQLTMDVRQWLGTLVIFLLEELVWNLSENSNPLFRRQSGAWLSLRQEIAPALGHIAAKLDTLRPTA